MQKKFNACLAGLYLQPGVSRLLLIQLALVAACVWLGLILYQLQDAGGSPLAVMLMLPAVIALALSSASRDWIAGMMLAAGLMYLAGQLIPAAWFQGPGFVLAALASAAAGVGLCRSRRPT